MKYVQMDASKAEELYKIGYEQTKKQLKELKNAYKQCIIWLIERRGKNEYSK